jgi:tetratricopeptide (TPR) repeat protein
MPLVLLAPLLLAQAPILLAQADGGVGSLPESVRSMRAGSVPRHASASEAQTIAAEAQTIAAPSRLDACLMAAASDPAQGEASAGAWLKQAKGSDQAQPHLCLGAAYSAQQRWDDAEQEFLMGRDIAATSDHLLRARLGAMAGNSELAAEAADRALPLLDVAHADALAAGNSHLAGDIAIDRARALVALKRDGDAVTALSEARSASPNNGLGWLLSATLSRRMGQLVQAQAQIETAAQLLPRDADLGLEAGVIAVLAGRNGAAAKSWQSVLDTAPRSPQAETARGYLAQLGPQPTAAGFAPGNPPSDAPAGR